VEDAVRRKATPRVAITVRVPVTVEHRLRRLLERYDDSVPELIERALTALEAQAAEVSTAA
jgi:hypothetical protein